MMGSSNADVALEWFGATTFRLRAKGLSIFLDTYLDKPSVLPKYKSIEDVTEADYIFISHAHFDHIPGADRLCIRTGAVVIANCEAINLLRNAGVPEEQLCPVAGGERIPLFSRVVREQAQRGECALAQGPPGAPPLPHHSLASMSAHIWPSLHCLIPTAHADLPDILDTGTIYTGAADPFQCTLEITRGMRYGLLEVGDLVPPEERDKGLQSFVEYISDQKRNVFSSYDGGQIMVDLVVEEDSALLWNAHLGAYDGIMKQMIPKPSIAILGIAGRGNLNGRPFDGSAAQFALNMVNWLDHPKQIIWCLHDQSPIKPFRIDTEAATQLVQQKTNSQVLTLEPNRSVQLSL